MRQLIESLCSEECAGRRPGTAGSLLARRLIRDELRAAGLDPQEQLVPACGGANVLATIRGSVNRYVLVGAHYDHLGQMGRHVFRGADDNAAAVAILVEVARALAHEHEGRGVIIAAFDGEEPPNFMTGAMGSREFVRANRLPIDFMICMDLVGHRLGPVIVPDDVGDTVFALGSERSRGTYDLVRSLKRSEPGVIIRPADAQIIPPLSDYEAFWGQRIPFLFLSAGRSRIYHTPEDTPDKLDYAKIAATARWLVRFVRATRVRDPIAFADADLDRGTLEEVTELLGSLSHFSRDAAAALRHTRTLIGMCDRDGNLPSRQRGELASLVGLLEAGLQ
jgi:hypothetical protein